MTPQLSRSRGFSLVELLISLVMTAIIIAGALTLLVSQQRQFRNSSADREMQETARIALEHITGNLRDAGFGVDPGLVFDFGAMGAARMDRSPGGSIFAATSYSCAAPVSCRDAIDGPDEIVFLSRDPSFGPHPLTVGATMGAAQLTFASALTAGNNVTLRSGQILQLVCYPGATSDLSWAYLQTGGNSITAGPTTVAPLVVGTTAFPRQNSWLGDACFGATGTLANLASLGSATEVFKVDRYRYHVQSYAADGTPQAWNTAGSRPYLMLDQGLGSEQVISPDVEDVQFAYVFPRDPSAATRLVGATASTRLTVGPTGIDVNAAAGCPTFSDMVTDAIRISHHPGNIGAVEVTIVVRSTHPDIRDANASAVIPAAANRPDVAAADTGYRRMVFRTTVAVRNLTMQFAFVPTYRNLTDGSTVNSNTGGG